MKAPERIWVDDCTKCNGSLAGRFPCAFKPGTEYIRADLVPQWQAALISEREDNLWNAYNEGHEKDGKWSHCFMSDAEWLASECGFDPRKGSFSAEAVKAAIPEAAKRVLAEVAPTPPGEG